MLNTLRQYAQAITVLLILIAIGTASFFAYRAGANSVRFQQAKEELRLIAVEDAAQNGAAKAIAKIKVANKTITQEIQRETRVVPDYSRCTHSDNGLRLLNDALTNRPVAAGDRVVPGADPAP